MNVKAAAELATVKRGRPTRLGKFQIKARIQLKGLHAIDKRTGAAKDLIAWRDAVIAQLGGTDTVTPTQMAVIEDFGRTRI